jgi:hypothetical protein
MSAAATSENRRAGSSRSASSLRSADIGRAEKAEIKWAQMFCESTIGQLLGPNPGEGARTDLDADRPHADGLPKQRVEEFRRYFGWRDELIEAVRNGARSRRSLLLLADQWLAGGLNWHVSARPPTGYDLRRGRLEPRAAGRRIGARTSRRRG